jgi:acyl carrier protein
MSTSIDTIVSSLKAVLANELNLNLTPDQIDDHAPLTDGGLNLDSIVIIELIGLVEAKFNFEFQDADLRTATFANVNALAEVVAKRISG